MTHELTVPYPVTRQVRSQTSPRPKVRSQAPSRIHRERRFATDPPDSVAYRREACKGMADPGESESGYTQQRFTGSSSHLTSSLHHDSRAPGGGDAEPIHQTPWCTTGKCIRGWPTRGDPTRGCDPPRLQQVTLPHPQQVTIPTDLLGDTALRPPPAMTSRRPPICHDSTTITRSLQSHPTGMTRP